MSAASGTSDYFVSKSREAIAGGQMDGNRKQRPPRANTGNPSFYPQQPMLPSKAFTLNIAQDLAAMSPNSPSNLAFYILAVGCGEKGNIELSDGPPQLN